MLKARSRELGAQLRIARRDSRLSIRQLAARAGVSASQISRIENGEVNRPNLPELSRLAEALDISLASVLDAAGVPLHRHLPDIGAYLRERYADLPDAALLDIEQHFDQVVRAYRGPGPKPREDEA